MKDIPEHIRERIIALHNHTSKTQREIAVDLGVSQNLVGLVIRHFNATGTVSTDRKGKCGRKQKLTPRDKTLTVRESKKDPAATAAEIRSRCGAVGQKVGLTTIRKTLREGDRKTYRAKKVPQFNEAKRISRLRWAKEFKTRPIDFWSKVSVTLRNKMISF